jgi:hypothetical protein
MDHAARSEADAIVINPAGFSFHSIPVLDALKAFDGPVVELHISNIHARDELHRHSIISTVAEGAYLRAGIYGYILGMQAAAHMLGKLPASPARPDPHRPEMTCHPGRDASSRSDPARLSQQAPDPAHVAAAPPPRASAAARPGDIRGRPWSG